MSRRTNRKTNEKDMLANNVDFTQIDFRGVYRLLSDMLAPFRKYLIILSGLSLVSSLYMNFRELTVKLIIDNLTAVNGVNQALIWVCVLIASEAFIEVCYRIYDYSNITFRPALKQHIVKQLMQKMLHYSYAYYQMMHPTQLARSIANIYEGIEESMMLIFDEFLCYALQTFSTGLFAFFVVDAVFGMLFVMWGLLWGFACVYWGGQMYILTYELNQAQVELEGNISDVFSHMLTVQSFHTSAHEMNQVQKWTDIAVEKERNLRRLQFKIWIFQGIVFCIMHAVCLFYLIYLYKNGHASVGDFSFIFGISMNLYSNLWDISRDVRSFIEHAGKIAQGLFLTTSKEIIEDSGTKTVLEISKGEIIFDKIAFQYNQFSAAARNNVNEDDEQDLLFKGEDTIHIRAGETVGLVGPSGSGKSTLVKLLLRIFELSAGRILIDGQDISNVTLESLRKSIAIVQQDAGLLMNRTIAENIGYGTFELIDDEARTIITQCAKQAHAHDFIMKLPQKYDTKLSDYGLNLSGGQRQRVAIARGFARNASIFILDEATSALDNITQTSVQEWIGHVTKGKTTLIIAHRLQTLRNTDSVLVFDHGRVVQHDTHEKLIMCTGLYKTMWDSQ